MRERTEGKSARLGLITAAAAVIAVLALLLSGLGALPGGAPAGGGAARAGAQVAVHPAATPATQLYINRSQSSGTYVPEYVTFNNTTTLNRLPYSATTGNGCRWVTIGNLSTTLGTPAYHEVDYRNVTTANASGTIKAHQYTPSFDACYGNAYWVNYVYFTLSYYQFRDQGLPAGVNTTLTVTFGKWPGASAAPASVTYSISKNGVAVLRVASNLTFNVTATKTFAGATSCVDGGQVCSYSQYTFSTWANSSTTNSSDPLKFGTDGLALISAGTVFWNVSYANSSVSANTQIGGFLVTTGGLLETAIFGFWWAIVLVLIVIVGVAWATSGRRRGGRRN